MIIGRQPVELYLHHFPGARHWGMAWGSCSYHERYKIQWWLGTHQIALVLGTISQVNS